MAILTSMVELNSHCRRLREILKNDQQKLNLLRMQIKIEKLIAND